MKTIAPTLRLHLWLETESGMLLGIGRAALLARIEACGSLNQAAKSMGMSYRAAWGRLKATEEQLGVALVEKASGRRGFELTDEARRLVRLFQAWQADVEAYALVRGREMFGWPIAAFEEKGDEVLDV